MFILDIIFGLILLTLAIAVLSGIAALIFAFISCTKIGMMLFILFIVFKLTSGFKDLAAMGKEFRRDIIRKIKGE